MQNFIYTVFEHKSFTYKLDLLEGIKQFCKKIKGGIKEDNIHSTAFTTTPYIVVHTQTQNIQIQNCAISTSLCKTKTKKKKKREREREKSCLVTLYIYSC
jgi:hypothetical protein